MIKPSVTTVVTCLLAACATPSPPAETQPVNDEPVAREEPTADTAPVTIALRCTTGTALTDWLSFVGEADALSMLELTRERDRILGEHQKQPGDGSRLGLGYLLSRPQPLLRDIAKSRALLAEIDSSSVYAPIRDLVLRELRLIDKVSELQSRIEHLQTQLDALKAIETDLTESQNELQELPQ